MGPRIAIIGGGSYQWTPKLLADFVNTPALRDAEIVLHDIDPAPLPKMTELAAHLAGLAGTEVTASGTTDRRRALEGADFVVANISTGGFASMRHDLEIPARYGVHQSVGDTVGPGGVLRSLRNIPVFLDIARDIEDLCPDALAPEPHQPDDHDLPGGDPRDRPEDGRPLPRDHDHAVPPEPAARRQLPRPDPDRRRREPPAVRDRGRRRRRGRLRPAAIDGGGRSRPGGRAAGHGGARRAGLREGLGRPGVDEGRHPPPLAAQARAVRPLRGAPRRRRSPPRRVLPLLPDRGLRLGGAVGLRPHLDRGPRARPGRPRRRRSTRSCVPIASTRCRRARWSRR